MAPNRRPVGAPPWLDCPRRCSDMPDPKGESFVDPLVSVGCCVPSDSGILAAFPFPLAPGRHSGRNAARL